MQFFRGIMVITEKNIRIYYTKAPVIIFGLLFPLFLFFAFYLGRGIDLSLFFPGFCAMSLFFTSSSVGPLITPWEKQAGTYERLLSFPVNINIIIIGDIIAGMIFGIFIGIFVLPFGMIYFHSNTKIVFLIPSILLSSFCFSSLGVLLSSPSLRSPSHIMMFSSLVRFPLVFISGIFIPLAKLQGAARVAAFFSPITYLVDLFTFSFHGRSYIHLLLDYSTLCFFSALFITISKRFHIRNLMRGL